MRLFYWSLGRNILPSRAWLRRSCDWLVFASSPRTTASTIRGGYGITPCATGFELVRVADGGKLPSRSPPGMCPGNPAWAADGKRFAFVNMAPDSVELWIGDARTGACNAFPACGSTRCSTKHCSGWPIRRRCSSSSCPSQRGAPPPVSRAAGPSIQETNGEKGESSTYESATR